MLAYESGRIVRVLSALGLCAGCLSVAGLAQGQSPPPSDAEATAAAPAEPERRINLTGAPSPTIDLSTPEPGPPVDRKYHQHEGLYVRVSGGIGTLLAANIETGSFDSSSSGATLQAELLVGGSPAPGFTVGGGLIGGLQLSGDWEADGIVGSQSADLTTLLIGPFADGYPNPKGGWHMGGLLGLASVSFQGPGGDDGDNAVGVGGAVWGGYDVWVAPEWSIGGSLRFDALRATSSADDNDITVSEVGATLSFSVLYN